MIISSKHNVYDSRDHILDKVSIGKYCWIVADAKFTSGVVLMDWTIVEAGAFVTKSFPNGYCVIGGVPGVFIQEVDKTKYISFKNTVEFNRYIRSSEFEAYRKKHLKV